MEDTRDKLKHPIQPVGLDGSGVARFKQNAIVSKLLDDGPFDLNDIARWDVSKEDREQFSQLQGYSLSGCPLSDETYEAADRMYEKGESEDKARIKVLSECLQKVREGLKIAVPAVFGMHPDDLEE